MAIGLYDVMEFPEKLVLAISRCGKSQVDLAKETGISQPSISALTQGKYRPYLYQVALLAKATRVPVAWLADDQADDLGGGFDSATPPEGLTFEEWMVLRAYHFLKIDMHEAIARLKGKDAAVGIPAMGPKSGESSADEAARQAELERERKRAANSETPKRPKPKSGG